MQLRSQMRSVMTFVREWLFAGYTVPFGCLDNCSNRNAFLFLVIMSLKIMMVTKRGFATVTDKVSRHSMSYDNVAMTSLYEYYYSLSGNRFACFR